MGRSSFSFVTPKREKSCEPSVIHEARSEARRGEEGLSVSGVGWGTRKGNG